MKISVTDEFLWDIYSYLEKVDDVVDLLAWPTSAREKLTGMENPIFAKYRHGKSKRKFGDLVYYLKKKGYIKIKNLKNKQAIILTKEGLGMALKASFKLDKKKRPDGKWIMLIFDVPEKYKKSRELLRRMLISLGYKMLQLSVWVSPYDVSEKTEKYLQFYDLDKFVKIFLIEEIN